MTFTKVTNSQPVVEYLARVIKDKLSANQKVLWLVPGGSAISVAAEVSHRLKDMELTNLTVTLTDERYGPVGHPDSNWQQLHEADFHLPGATMVPVLHGHDSEQTTSEFAKHLQEYCRAADYCIGFFGIGPDGHTAGVLPNSPAVTASDWAAYYVVPEYQRITMTPLAIAALDEAVVYAMGEAKLEALNNLKQELPLDEQPAQILKKVPKVTVFNDQIGETS